jgi:hypothetical protein
MDTPINEKRNSLCILCGKRLSIKSAAGDIRWNPSCVDDKGIYCDACFEARTTDGTQKRPRQKKE